MSGTNTQAMVKSHRDHISLIWWEAPALKSAWFYACNRLAWVFPFLLHFRENMSTFMLVVITNVLQAWPKYARFFLILFFVHLLHARSLACLFFVSVSRVNTVPCASSDAALTQLTMTQQAWAVLCSKLWAVLVHAGWSDETWNTVPMWLTAHSAAGDSIKGEVSDHVTGDSLILK